MSMSSAGGVADLAIDRRGVSVATTTRFAEEDPRIGTAWGRPDLAAGTPVHFHPLNAGPYLMLLREYWDGATMGTAGPQYYSAHDAHVGAAAVEVHPETGSMGVLRPLPTNQAGTPELTAAASRSDSLFTVSRLGDDALVQHLQYSPWGTLGLLAERVMPEVAGVIYDRGVEAVADDLLLIGANGDDELHLARRSWPRLGDRNSAWLYWDGSSWSGRGDEAGPMLDTASAPLTSLGPASLAQYRGRFWLSTTAQDGDDMVGRIHTSRTPFGPWEFSQQVALGLAAGWPGGGLYLQSHLGATLATPSASGAGVSYVWTAAQADGDDEALRVQWGLLGV